jgi:hypothetical protein
MLNPQQSGAAHADCGLNVRALSEPELDSVLKALGARIGPILNRYALVPESLLPYVPPDSLPAAAWELFDALVSIAPTVVAFGLGEPDSVAAAKRLPACQAIMVFCETVERTFELFGRETVWFKLAEACAGHCEIPAFIAPMVRNRLNVLAAHVEISKGQSVRSNRSARRRASRIRTKGR